MVIKCLKEGKNAESKEVFHNAGRGNEQKRKLLHFESFKRNSPPFQKPSQAMAEATYKINKVISDLRKRANMHA